MNKLFGFVLVLAIGLGAGVPIGVMLQTPQTPETPQGDIEGRVTIEGISCTFTNNDADMEVLLQDHFPQTDLEGNVAIYQDGRQWTGEVDWHLNGYGYAEIACDSINGNESFRLKYRDNYTGVKYVDRTINWDDVSITFTFMATEQLEIQGAEFIAGNNVNITAQNTGTDDLTISKYKIGVSGTPTNLASSVPIAQGASAEVTVPLTWVAGTTYDIYLITSTGKQFPYRATAP
jgi:hypothetical protein